MNQKRYTHTAKVTTLRILEKNDFIFLKTEKLTGIRRQTIKVWAEVYGPDVFSGTSPLEQALKLVDNELKQNDLKTIFTCMSAMSVALEQLIEVIPSEKNIVKLAKALKILFETFDKMEEKKGHTLRRPNYNSNQNMMLQLPENR
jgi:hypothetical protein